MASFDDVRLLALALPETGERISWGSVHWTVRQKSFVWERPLRKTDRAALGDTAPDGPILGVRVADEGIKLALIADDPAVFFTVPHFDGYPAVLVRLDRIEFDELDELVREAWIARAPARLVKQLLAEG